MIGVISLSQEQRAGDTNVELETSEKTSQGGNSDLSTVAEKISPANGRWGWGKIFWEKEIKRARNEFPRTFHYSITASAPNPAPHWVMHLLFNKCYPHANNTEMSLTNPGRAPEWKDVFCLFVFLIFLFSRNWQTFLISKC